MSASDDGSRPISVAELLARNGTIGAPSAGGHRRRRRRKGDTVSVAELTSEIPVVRDDEPVAGGVGDALGEELAEEAVVAEVAEEEVAEEEVAAEEVAEEEVAAEVAEEAVVAEVAEEEVAAEVAEEAVVEEVAAEVAAEVAEEAVVEEVAEEEVVEEVAEEAVVEETSEETTGEAVAAPTPVPAPVENPPPLANDPSPSRRRGPERGYDPRPVRRASGAEQMAYDPVDQSVDLAELVDEHAVGAAELQSYLRASGGTLFSGETVADDLARRGLETEVVGPVAEPDADADATTPPARPRGALRLLWQGLIAVLQSLLAVAFGAGLFIAFGQLWQWNSIVALALSVLVILGLVVAVRVVRRTEDIASTLIAVAVGALVTLGPLALLQSI